MIDLFSCSVIAGKLIDVIEKEFVKKDGEKK